MSLDTIEFIYSHVYTTKEQGRTGRDLKLGGGELAKYHWIFSFGW